MNVYKLFIIAILLAVSACMGGEPRVVDRNAQASLSGKWRMRANGFRLRVLIEQESNANQEGTFSLTGGFVGESVGGEGVFESRITGLVDLQANSVRFIRTDADNKPFQEYEGKIFLSEARSPKQMKGTFSQGGNGSYTWFAEKIDGN